MKVFAFHPADHRAEYSSRGWVHIPQGVTPEFHRLLVEYAENELRDHLLDRHAIKGKKEQSLFEFPDGVDYPDELFDVIAELCGLDRASMTLSERHIQAYEPNAAPEPAAHKDRYPSQVSVGLSIRIPEESRLVLYPYDHREANPFNTSAGLRQSLQPHELPEVILKDAREVQIQDRDGDVVVFPGSTTWHLRRRSAGAINLYLKFNDFECDPLGEDPRTASRRDRTLEALSAGDGEVDSLAPALGRRFDTVTRAYTRDGWREVLQAAVFGEAPFPLTDLQFRALRAVDGRRPLAELSRELADGSEDRDRVREQLLRLAERGALDLVEPRA